MPVSTRNSRYPSSPVSMSGKPSLSQSVVPPVKMPLLQALLRGQSPGTGSPRFYPGTPTSRRTGSSIAGFKPSHMQSTPLEKKLITSPSTPVSPRLNNLSRNSSLGSMLQRTPLSPRFTPVQLSRKSSAASSNTDTVGYSEDSFASSKRFNTPMRLSSPGVNHYEKYMPTPDREDKDAISRRRAMSAHAGSRKALPSSTSIHDFSNLSSSTSSLLKGLLDASRNLSSPKKATYTPLTPVRNQTPTRMRSEASLKSPLSTSFTSSAGWATPATATPSTMYSSPAVATPSVTATPVSTRTPDASAMQTPAVATPGANGRKVPSHISNMVCSWTANGQEDQNKYAENGYMKVKKGMVLDNRYHVITKLGWGEFATVWLAWDQESLKTKLDYPTQQFVAIKISKCAEHVSNAAREEAALLTYITKYSRGSGSTALSTVLNVFNHQAEYGNHVCMVFPVLGQNILCLVEQAHRHRNNIRGITNPMTCPKRPNEDIAFVKSCLRACLRALNELSRIGVVHTDLKPENILLTTVAKKTREAMREWQESVAKLRGSPWEATRLIDASEVPEGSNGKEASYVRISDFGLSSLLDPDAKQYNIGCHARRLQCKKRGVAHNPLGVILQTREYRAPEVLFGNPITPTTDVWSIGCMAYELVTGTFLMDPKKDPKRRAKPEEEINNDHISMMQQLIGAVPISVSKGVGKHLPKYFTPDGNFMQQDKTDRQFPQRNLKQELLYFLHEKDAELMASFIIECLGSYDATKRATAEVMLKHPFLAR
eukprot:TRINITY_DN3253_c0_g1_i4.p1 TRINITY_DN3253_c0_g1~~TRINITY_DN3253_c0_g1_i4.p1  ORF type:complete len:769 (+),score=280.54 TRINITY_DN3253_c0_g1_i4:42-2348(+)